MMKKHQPGCCTVFPCQLRSKVLCIHSCFSNSKQKRDSERAFDPFYSLTKVRLTSVPRCFLLRLLSLFSCICTSLCDTNFGRAEDAVV
jgi:hypothetical protein